MSMHTITSPVGSEAKELEAALLLPASQSNFASTSTGSMELVGIRERKPVKVSDFESQYRQPEEKTTVVETVKEIIAKQCSKFSMKKVLLSNFPITLALKTYKVLRDLPNDVVAGLTSGIMMIPQGSKKYKNCILICTGY